MFNVSKKIKYVILGVFILIIFLYLFLVCERYRFNDRIYSDIKDAKKFDYIIVFGAGLKNSNTPSDILADRIKTAVYLYKNNISKKMLMSGDGIEKSHDEVNVMSQYAQSLGVEKGDIITDESGINTFSTCDRAKNTFNINNAILVTQYYHINRALYVCNKIGIDSYGFISDLNVYKDIKRFKFREFFAFIKSLIDIISRNEKN